MWVKRMSEYPAEIIRIGDIIEFTLNDGEEVQALAVDSDGVGTLFCMVDCISEGMKMNDQYTNEGGYSSSLLRKRLNSTVLKRFPDSIRQRMTPFANGDYLRLPTEREIFGENEYGEPELMEGRQWEVMKLRRNRIAFSGKNEYSTWYWLQNKRRGSQQYCCAVLLDGSPLYRDADSSGGVRPAFYIQ